MEYLSICVNSVVARTAVFDRFVLAVKLFSFIDLIIKRDIGSMRKLKIVRDIVVLSDNAKNIAVCSAVFHFLDINNTVKKQV